MEQTEETITTEEILAAMEQMTSYASHLGNFHVPQLEAFLAGQNQ